MIKILLVCTANICRSPMAEGIFKALMATRSLDSKYGVGSAGTWGQDNLPAFPLAVETLRKRGIDISNHRSRIIKGSIIDEANLVLTMEQNHKEALGAEFPFKKNKIFILSEMAGESFDVEDPIKKTPEDFEKTADILTALVLDGLSKITNLGSAK